MSTLTLPLEFSQADTAPVYPKVSVPSQSVLSADKLSSYPLVQSWVKKALAAKLLSVVCLHFIMQVSMLTLALFLDPLTIFM